MKWLNRIFSKSSTKVKSLEKENALIKKLGGYDVSYSKKQKIAIYICVISAYSLNEGHKLSSEEFFIQESISEYLGISKLDSNDYIKEFTSKGLDQLVFTLKDLNNEQKDFYIVILNLISSVGGNVSLKTDYAIGMCQRIGISEESFYNKMTEVNLIMKG